MHEAHLLSVRSKAGDENGFDTSEFQRTTRSRNGINIKTPPSKSILPIKRSVPDSDIYEIHDEDPRDAKRYLYSILGTL